MSNMLMKGKRGLIMGLANDKSIAWGIAKECADAGAELAFSYQGEALKKRVAPLANSVGSDFILECDVSDIESLDELFFEIEIISSKFTTRSFFSILLTKLPLEIIVFLTVVTPPLFFQFFNPPFKIKIFL